VNPRKGPRPGRRDRGKKKKKRSHKGQIPEAFWGKKKKKKFCRHPTQAGTAAPSPKPRNKKHGVFAIFLHFVRFPAQGAFGV